MVIAALRKPLYRLASDTLADGPALPAPADREPAPDLFGVLRTALDLMQTGDPQLIALWFAAQLLVHSGYAPTTDRCQVCGRSVRSGAAFSYALGGVLCGTDQHRDPDAVMASAGALRAIGYLLHVQPEALARLVLDPRQRTEVGGLLQGYAEYRLETKLKSPLVIQRLLKTGTPTPASPARGGARERGNGGTRTR